MLPVLGKTAHCTSCPLFTWSTFAAFRRTTHHQTSAATPALATSADSLRSRHSPCLAGVLTSSSAALRQRKILTVTASQTGDSPNTATLPIFPLNIVALPATTVPLNIFEARYRVLFSTLLAGSEGLEEGLINDQSPFFATRKFGMCYFNQDQSLAQIGTVLHIKEHVRLDTGQIVVVSKGQERFKVVKVLETVPILICEVEYVEDEDSDVADSSEVKVLAEEVAELFRNTLRLDLKVRKMTATEEQMELPELTSLAPRDFSFWVASLFVDSQPSQQSLLELMSIKERLLREKAMLSEAQKYLSAKVALAAVLPPDPPNDASNASYRP